MARKGATRKADFGRRSGHAPARRTTGNGARLAPLRQAMTGIERVLLAVLALDGALSLVLHYIHAQLRVTSGAYASFCNVSDRVNCDTVLASPQSELLGVPVSVWALLTYLLLAALVFWRRRAGEPGRTRATLLLVGIAAWAFAFSVYMAVVATFVIGALCLLCSGTYVLNGVVAVLAWRLGRADAHTGPLLSPRHIAIGVAGIAVALAIVGGLQFAVTPVSKAPLTREEVRASNPEFYQWYTSRPVVTEFPASEHVKGPADAPISIVEFSDFQCTHCARAFRDLHDLERRHRGTLRVAFHHFPLDSGCNPHVASHLHQSACLAAIAAECAARYGRFWEYHDRLFSAQDRLGRDDLVANAAALGIDRATFSACLDDPASRARVLADVEAGARLGVRSTPTLFINGRTVEGALERSAYEYILAMENHS
jgi:protein-disulfide isomerase